MQLRSLQTTAVCWILVKIVVVTGHGRLMDPPARNSMWRFGFNTPINYHDNELICGGPSAHQEKECGVCGDDANDLNGPHVVGGRYARGIIGRKYKIGQVIEVEVELTANHWGRFEMHVCPINDPRREATDDCFKKFPLFLAHTKDKVPFVIPKNYKKWGIFRYTVRLPPTLTCSQCVLQWTYYTGLAFGPCPNGNISVDCGGYATFKNCADIAILGGSQGGNYLRPKPSKVQSVLEIPAVVFLGRDDNEGNHTSSSPFVATSASTTSTTTDSLEVLDNITLTEYLNSFGYSENEQNSFSSSSTTASTTVITTTTTRPTTRATTSSTVAIPQVDAIGNTENHFEYNEPPEELPTPNRFQVCVATPIFRKLTGADEWCMQNCLKVPPKCPAKMCMCPDTCDATGVMKGVPGAETWCQAQCIVYPYKCHEEVENRCKCYRAVHEESVFTDYFPFTETKLGSW